MDENRLYNEIKPEENADAVTESAAVDTAPVPDKKKKWRIGCIVVPLIIIAVCFAVVFCYIFFSFYKPNHTVITENGKIEYEYYMGLGRVKVETEYDKNDRVIKKTKYDDEGFESHRYEYIYDDQGVLTEEWDYFYEDLESIKEYDANGIVVREKAFLFDEKTPDYTYEYEYDAHGRVAVKHQYDKEGKYIGHEAYEYDEQGRKVVENQYDEAGKITGYYEYEYTEGGKRVEWKYYDASGKLTESGGYPILQ